jgi:glycine cleavage system H protein
LQSIHKVVNVSEIPEELYYSESHQWLRIEEDGSGTVGITDFAQEELGDVVYIELPEAGAQINAGQEVSVVESVKTASDVFSPVTGEITEVNEALQDEPELLNTSPYEAGWIYKIALSNPTETDDLMSAQDYEGSTD